MSQVGFPSGDLGEEGEPSTRTAIRDRLSLAVGGKWTDLAHALLEDLHRHAAQMITPREPHIEEQDLQASILQAAIMVAGFGSMPPQFK